MTDRSFLKATSTGRSPTELVCPGDDSSPDSCYLYRQNRQTWDVARDRCDDLGGYLVAIETPSELSTIREEVFILHNVTTVYPTTWTGLNDRLIEGVYTWEQVACPGDPSSPDSCYLHHQDQQTWEVARDRCRDLGGYLVAIETQSEMISLVNVLISHYGITPVPRTWTGLNDRSTEGVYTWEHAGGTLPLSSTMWEPGQPWGRSAMGQDCVAMEGNEIKDSHCSDQYGYICEFRF
ncbi:lithostathine-1-alpha-like [Diadema antillarum]|uniref:lithostathine-1-alpha-like n=1 Tax=Diadema antillarum TaxID=105358 RepID=UPI003A876984